MQGLGNQNNPLAARMQGVRTARDGSAGQGTGTPSTVTHVIEGKVKFVAFNDERGNQAVAMYFEVGGQLYAAADTVQWCNRLMPATDWLAKAVADHEKRTSPVRIPKEDTVDVMDESGNGDEDPTS